MHALDSIDKVMIMKFKRQFRNEIHKSCFYDSVINDHVSSIMKLTWLWKNPSSNSNEMAGTM